MSTITFLVPGHLEAGATRGGATRGGATRSGAAVGGNADDWAGFDVTTVRVGLARSGAPQQRLEATLGEDAVILGIANGPELILHPATARDLLRSQTDGVKSPDRGGSAAPANIAADATELSVPTSLRWADLDPATPTRGGLGQVPLLFVKIVKNVAKLFAGEGAQVAADIASAVDTRVREGVYQLEPQALGALEATPLAAVSESRKPFLVLIHGTFVDTASTFGKLWQKQPAQVRRLFDRYESVLALDHATLGKSPIHNALTLARALPHHAQLHLLTHSRGGLVAEVLVRVAARPHFTAGELDAFSPDDRSALEELSQLFVTRKLTVTRVVRVACPARGTLLASGRLDAYLSVFRWTLQVAGVSVAPQLLQLLQAIVAEKSNVDVLPGIAAMHPESALVQWLHPSDLEAPSDLRVVAGDADGSSVTSWLKTLLADAFFWTDNDLVVQTRSMYGGVRRSSERAHFVRAEGGDVSHFTYFDTPRTVQAIVRGLLEDSPADYRPIGPESWAGKSATGVRARRVETATNQPVLFFLPGILGSHLKRVDGDRVWLSHRVIGGLKDIAYSAGNEDVAADGVVEMVYADLLDHLSQSHDVHPFGYDWRRPLEEEAHRLAQSIEAVWEKRPNAQVRLLAHSMGGLLARTLLLERPDVWKRIFAQSSARFVMLGTPNAGSWAPMQVLSGDDSFGNALAFAGAPFHAQESRQLMANMPGFLQLQANLLSEELLAQTATWKARAASDRELLERRSFWHRLSLQHRVYDWGIPPQHVLDRARRLRERLDAQLQGDLDPYLDRTALVLGQAEFTPDGFVLAENEGLVYLNAVDGGDGRVTHASARIPGVATYRCPETDHTNLAKRDDAFADVVALLEGKTPLKKFQNDVVEMRGFSGPSSAPAVQHVRSRPAHEALADVTPDLRFPRAEVRSSSGASRSRELLRISVLNGNLRFVEPPLLVGHYRSDVLSGTEHVVDQLMNGVMTAALSTGRYPVNPDDAIVFMNTKASVDRSIGLPRPRGVIVVGLGDEGSLRPQSLTEAVRGGVIAWARRLLEAPAGAPATFEIAATLLGSGGVGISAGAAARAIAYGVAWANESLQEVGWPTATELTLVELYLTRATEAWESLRLLEHAEPGSFVLSPRVTRGAGSLQQTLETSYRGVQYDLASVAFRESTIEFTIDSQRARTEIHRRPIQVLLIEQMIADAAQSARGHEGTNSTLFQLLIPPEADVFLRQSGQLLLEVDEASAVIPWELLDLPEKDRPGDGRPWAISTQLVRKLRTAEFHARPRDATAEDQVLVIGEPLCGDRYARLPGALAEAREVAKVLSKKLAQGVNHVERKGPLEIVNALHARPYRVVHIAGHGEPGEKGGVVLADGIFLGPKEIRALPVVPELVFVNCCHLAAGDLSAGLGNPATFAANVAKSLIEAGVRCVVAAGWAVEDEPARRFAEQLYATLLEGGTFAEAVTRAREAARLSSPMGSTWAAYQCYGDPQWRLREQTGDNTVPFVDTTKFEISSQDQLLVRLRDLAVRLQFDDDDSSSISELTSLESLFGSVYGSSGDIAEAFGLAYERAGDMARAIDWLERALRAENGLARAITIEQLAHLRVRNAWDVFRLDHDEPVVVHARETILSVIPELERLREFASTARRESLLGAAYKRLARLERQLGADAAARSTLSRAAHHYAEAMRLADLADSADSFHPALNLLALQVADGATEPDGELIAFIEASLAEKWTTEPDFPSAVGIHELAFYRALATNDAKTLPEVRRGFEDLYGRVSSSVIWGSVSDQARFVAEWRHPENLDPSFTEILDLLRRFAKETPV